MKKREIIFTPAWDRRCPDPSKNYGVHGVEMRWILKGKKGAVQFVVFTNWHLPEVEREMFRPMAPMAADLGFHAHALPNGYESSAWMAHTDDCDILGGPCLYDGSGLNAVPVLERLVREGGEAVWEELEGYYRSLFGRLRAEREASAGRVA